MFSRVNSKEWNLIQIEDERRDKILSAPSPLDLIEEVESSKSSLITARIEGAINYPGYSRCAVEIKVDPLLYDYIFHGPTGYRAQYYQSKQQGEAYNRRFIESIFALVKNHEISGMDTREIERSLLGPISIATWYKDNNDALIFRGAKEILEVSRWQEYYSKSYLECRMGLKDMSLENPRIFFKGTWIDINNKDKPPPPPTKDRSKDLFSCGWT